MMSNNSKPYQSLLARRAGFAVPDTLVSNDAVEVARFARSPGGLVYKSTNDLAEAPVQLNWRGAAGGRSSLRGG